MALSHFSMLIHRELVLNLLQSWTCFSPQRACGLRFYSYPFFAVENWIQIWCKRMGSEVQPDVKVHVTGFKKFHGVADNPTETIVSNLKGFIQRRGISSGITLGSCTILEAAGDGALPKLYQIMESAVSESLFDSSVNERVIWVSFSIFLLFLTLTV